MLAVDTNIIVRYLTADHPEQFVKAKGLIDGEDIFICTTVLLETECVLRRGYRFSSEQIIAALTAFAGLPRVTLEDPLRLPRHWAGWPGGWISPMRCISKRPRAARRSSALTKILRQWRIPSARLKFARHSQAMRTLPEPRVAARPSRPTPPMTGWCDGAAVTTLPRRRRG